MLASVKSKTALEAGLIDFSSSATALVVPPSPAISFMTFSMISFSTTVTRGSISARAPYEPMNACWNAESFQNVAG